MSNEHEVNAALAVERAFSELRAELQTTMRGIQVQGALPIALPSPFPAAGYHVRRTSGRLAGFALAESTGALPATVKLYDGGVNDGDLLMQINLGANESARDWFLPGGLSYTHGLSVLVSSGTIVGSLFLGADDA